jgi:hypothetical protein
VALDTGSNEAEEWQIARSMYVVRWCLSLFAEVDLDVFA